MKLSEIVTNIRDQIQDPVSAASQKYTDHELTRYINLAQNYLFRWQCDADSSYHNIEYNIRGSAATQLHANVFAYDVPLWAFRIVKVQETRGSTETPGKTYMPTSELFDAEGWRWDRGSRLRLNPGTFAPDITVSICKTPAKLHLGTCPADGTSTTMFSPNIPATSANEYVFENQVDAYANSVIEMTGVADGARDPVGQIGRVVNSSRVGAGSNYRIQFTVSNAWTEVPDTNDTYEMHPEVDEAHMRLLILIASQYAFQKYNNVGALQAIRPEFMDERKRFIDSCSPRDDGLAKFWGTPLDRIFSIDPDRDLYLRQ